MKIYLAGPLFTEAEYYFNLKVRDFLVGEGFSVFLPQEECKNACIVDDPKDKAQYIFQICSGGVEDCDAIVAIMDGADADSGTCWEFGYGYGLDKMLIALRTDFRQSGDFKGFNAMVYGSADKVIESEDWGTELANFLVNYVAE